MFYPTYQSKTTNIVHIVEDQNTCSCGVKHSSFYELNRRDLRNIVFKPVVEVTCENCKQKLKDLLN